MLLLAVLLFLAYAFLVYLDFTGTMAYTALGGREGNPILGPNPKKSRMLWLQVPAFVLHGGMIIGAIAGTWPAGYAVFFLAISVFLKARVVLRNAGSMKQLKDRLAAGLPIYHVPVEVVPVDKGIEMPAPDPIEVPVTPGSDRL